MILFNRLMKAVLTRTRRLANSFVLNLMVRRLRSRPRDSTAVQSIVIVRPDHLGDFVLTTPLFKALRRKFPSAKVQLIATAVIAPLAVGCPDIDTVVVIPRGFTCWRPYLEIPLFTTMRIAWFALRTIRPLRPDMLVLPRVDADWYGSIWMAAFSGASRRFGFSESTTRWSADNNRGSDRVFTDIVRTAPGTHEVESLRALARHMELPTETWSTYLWWSSSDEELVEKIFSVVRDHPTVVFAPGAADDRRRWPASRFGEAGRALESAGFRIAIVGGPSDVECAEEILSCMTPGIHLNLAGKLSLQQTAAALARCTIFVGNDSGPMHMAAAVRLPCVEISSFPVNGDASHVNSPSRFGPWAVRSIVVQPQSSLPPCEGHCRDSRAHCILQITSDQVRDAVVDLMGRLERVSWCGAPDGGSS